MNRRKEHGDRNSTLCSKLLDEKVYLDWVVTTGFYSSIHLVEHKILPCEINSIMCKNINEVKRAYKMQGRHAARERLVREKLSAISVKYKWLDDKSRYSRYTTFKVTISEAQKTRQYLNDIIEVCS